MNENRSLEDFLGGSADGRDDEAGDGLGGDGEESADPDETAETTDAVGDDPESDVAAEAESDGEDAADADIEPVALTYHWDRGGAACEDCGETVERRWADGDAFVCADCKEW